METKNNQVNSDDTNPKDKIGRLKPNLHLVPPALVVHVAKAMENGAKKFGPYNWREKKVSGSVYISAALRHIHSYFDGEDEASDSHVHHLAHAAACLGILLDALETGNLLDDRPLKGACAKMIERLTTKAQETKPSEHLFTHAFRHEAICVRCGLGYNKAQGHPCIPLTAG